VAARLSLSGLSTRTSPADCLHTAAEACEHIGRVIQVARTLTQYCSCSTFLAGSPLLSFGRRRWSWRERKQSCLAEHGWRIT
jgi:hypothetical protein